MEDPVRFIKSNLIPCGDVKKGDNLDDTLNDEKMLNQWIFKDSRFIGINYCSQHFTALSDALKGYQADIDGNHTGQHYEERNQTTCH
jgi:hypothetical protein